MIKRILCLLFLLGTVVAIGAGQTPTPSPTPARTPPPAPHTNLKVGQAAPDFTLPTVDRKSEVSLASFRGDRPVVLVFGSYT